MRKLLDCMDCPIGAYSSSINVFAVEIPLSVRAAEISAEGSSIYEYDPKGKAAFAYTALIKEGSF